MEQVRGRFAPSPTGEMHLGNAWTALLAWLDIRRQNGTMVLRMEDLDPDRSRPEYARQMMDDLLWLGLDWDEGPEKGGPYGPYSQGERRALYEAAVKRLNEQGLVYPCYCTRAELHATQAPHAGESEPVYSGVCRQMTDAEKQQKFALGRKPSLRLAVPDRVISFQDGIYGSVSQNLAADCGDFIIRRSDGVHAYQLAVVADDGAMAISRVVRGSDLLASTPRQLFLYEKLGLKPPQFAHVPLLIGPDGHRLSKRQKDLSLAALRGRGVSPYAIIGYLAWKAGINAKNQPIAARDLVPRFTLDSISQHPVIATGELI